VPSGACGRGERSARARAPAEAEDVRVQSVVHYELDGGGHLARAVGGDGAGGVEGRQQRLMTCGDTDRGEEDTGREQEEGEEVEDEDEEDEEGKEGEEGGDEEEEEEEEEGEEVEEVVGEKVEHEVKGKGHGL